MKPIQIVKFNDDGQVELSLHQLQDVLTKCRDRPVAVISVAGMAKLGKSTIMNLIIQFMKLGPAKWRESEDVIANVPDGTNTDLFEARSTNHPVTSGIWIYPEPFIRTTSDGKEVAVLLIDSQGTFDTTSPPSQSLLIHAITLSISSILMYNGKDSTISSIELDRFASSAKDYSKPGTKYQQLMFLIRDVMSSKSSETILNQLLAEKETYIDVLKNFFESITAHALPRISERAVDYSKEPLTINDMDQAFLNGVEELCTKLINNVVTLETYWTPETIVQVIELLTSCYKNGKISYESVTEAFETQLIQLYSEVTLNELKRWFSIQLCKRVEEKKREMPESEDFDYFRNLLNKETILEDGRKIESLFDTEIGELFKELKKREVNFIGREIKVWIAKELNEWIHNVTIEANECRSSSSFSKPEWLKSFKEKMKRSWNSEKTRKTISVLTKIVKGVAVTTSIVFSVLECFN